MDYPEKFQQLTNSFEQVLEEYLADKKDPARLLWQAMRYSCLDGGKRLRPLLVYITGGAFGVATKDLDAIAVAVELIHCYSLIHDDLPAMDDDDLRRGRASCHIEFDEATAILAGDALQSLAFKILSNKNSALSAEQQLAIIKCLSQASGPSGMAAGQALDLAATGKDITTENLQLLHSLKTGALLVACVRMAAIAAEVSAEQLNALTNYAENLGLAFQIKDDILDVVGETAALGKPQGSDAELDKATFVTNLGLAGAKAELLASHKATLHALEPLGHAAENLRQYAELLLIRDY